MAEVLLRGVTVPHRAKFQTLSDRRAACKHRQLISLILTDVTRVIVGGRRFCLFCGEMEEISKKKHDFTVLVSFDLVRKEYYEKKLEYEEAVAFYMERLHVRGLFKEFDAKGNWLGDDDPHIVRGED